jgi:LDH2 family malate/lactate/ureidoglycolate dehydrogenase
MVDQNRQPPTAAFLRVSADELRRVETQLLEASGLSPEDAALAADVFVQSDLRGEESHGARLFIHLLARIEVGGDRPKSEVAVVRDRHAVAVWDAQRGIGQVIAAKAMHEAIRKAKTYGVGIVGVRNANSYTSAKYYPLLAAAEGMIGITYANSGVKLVVPHSGSRTITGTNPLSIAAPTKNKPTFVLDMAVSVAMEKIRQADERNQSVPVGWGIDVEGRDTTDPKDILASKALLPIAGPKGFGLGLAHEILTCVLMGGHLFGGGGTGFRPYANPMNVSQFFEAINVDWFMPLDEFRARMDEAMETVNSIPPRPGFDRVYYPGEHSFLEEGRRKMDGVPFPKAVITQLDDWCGRKAVAPFSRFI